MFGTFDISATFSFELSCNFQVTLLLVSLQNLVSGVIWGLKKKPVSK